MKHVAIGVSYCLTCQSLQIVANNQSSFEWKMCIAKIEKSKSDSIPRGRE